MSKKIIKIDSDACIGCGLCAGACRQGAIEMVDGKAKLVREDYCDGLGNCLPVCPVGAITFTEPDETPAPAPLPCGCPGTLAKAIEPKPAPAAPVSGGQSELRQWPIQIKLVPENASYLDGAHLLVAADCTAFASGHFHARHMRGKITIIGCPKLDEGDYTAKLTSILTRNDIKSVTVARMEVPCCGGLERAVVAALRDCGKMIPWQVVTIATDGSEL